MTAHRARIPVRTSSSEPPPPPSRSRAPHTRTADATRSGTRSAAFPGAVINGDNGEVACDHYHRYRDDVALMKSMGLQTYRFSTSWSRVRPDGGPVNPQGIDFYKRLVDELLDAGILPWLTLYHWDLPQALQEKGGWANRDTADLFTEYALDMHDALGDRVNVWTTLNEPWCSSFLSYTAGVHAPGHYSAAEGMLAAHHLLLGHGQAVRELRARDASLNLGITLNLTVADPVDENDPADLDAARRIDGQFNRWFLDPIFRGAYPAESSRTSVRRMPPPRRARGGHPSGRPRGDLDADRHARRELLPRRDRRRSRARGAAARGRGADRAAGRLAVPVLGRHPLARARTAAHAHELGGPARGPHPPARPRIGGVRRRPPARRCTSPRTAPPTTTSASSRTARCACTTTIAPTSCARTSARSSMRSTPASTCAATSTGRCSTTSSGHGATRSGSGSSASTTTPSCARVKDSGREYSRIIAERALDLTPAPSAS